MQNPWFLQTMYRLVGLLRSDSLACLQLGFVIAMVTGIHFVEAYLLNPAIYSAHLKLHPLLVISTLVVAEHSLGVWGLLLAGQCPAPLCKATYVFCAAIPCDMWGLSADHCPAMTGVLSAIVPCDGTSVGLHEWHDFKSL